MYNSEYGRFQQTIETGSKFVFRRHPLIIKPGKIITAPGNRGVSVKFKSVCRNYSTSHFYENFPLGKYNPANGYRCEDLEKLSFED